jgi:hypothetical protein
VLVITSARMTKELGRKFRAVAVAYFKALI